MKRYEKMSHPGTCLFTIATKAQLLPRGARHIAGPDVVFIRYSAAHPPPPAPFMWKFSLVRHNSERAHNERAGEGVIFPIFPNRLPRWIFNYSTEKYMKERRDLLYVAGCMWGDKRSDGNLVCDVGGKLVFFTKASISKWVLNKYVILKGCFCIFAVVLDPLPFGLYTYARMDEHLPGTGCLTVIIFFFFSIYIKITVQITPWDANSYIIQQKYQFFVRQSLQREYRMFTFVSGSATVVNGGGGGVSVAKYYEEPLA